MREGHTTTDRVQLEAMRRMGGVGRIALLRSFSRSLIAMNRRAFLRSHPNASDRDAKIAFVASHYGDELARRFAERLA